MRSAIVLTFAAAASAVVIPDALSGLREEVKQAFDHSTVSSFRKTLQGIEAEFSNALQLPHPIRRAKDFVFQDEPKLDIQNHDLSDFTIGEIIARSNYTTKFHKLVAEHESVGKRLNDSSAKLTLFVPIDKAFEHIPHHKKPSPEIIENALNYHIGIGEYPAGRVLFTHTLPTAYKEPLLGDKPQRLRTSVGLSGVRVNVYSKVIAVNIKAKNGWIHAVNKILVPPPAIGREISLFPSYFSTLLLAYDKTDFVKYVHNISMVGSTVFVPSNDAWVRLGARANAFLFNTETGKKYLKALLKYQIVPNTTVYSDEIYGEQAARVTNDLHLELPTLLGKSVGVDIHSWKGFRTIILNGAVVVGFEDGVAKNGVVQVVKNVPLPPCRKGHKHKSASGEIEVEDLKERLRDYVEREKEEELEIPGEL